MATHLCSCLKKPTEEPGKLQSKVSQSDLTEQLSTHTHAPTATQLHRRHRVKEQRGVATCQYDCITKLTVERKETRPHPSGGEESGRPATGIPR